MGKVTGVGSIVIDLTAFTPKLPVAAKRLKVIALKRVAAAKAAIR